MTRISQVGNESSPEINTIEARVIFFFLLLKQNFKITPLIFKLPYYTPSKQILGDRFIQDNFRKFEFLQLKAVKLDSRNLRNGNKFSRMIKDTLVSSNQERGNYHLERRVGAILPCHYLNCSPWNRIAVRQNNTGVFSLGDYFTSLVQELASWSRAPA